jgi:hypothetical protein
VKVYFDLRKSDLERRARGLRRFADWNAEFGIDCPPGVAIEGVGLIWDLLPEESRDRPVDPSGVRRMHDQLRHLKSPR